MLTKTGIGYDAHRLVPDRRLVIGGVLIPFELGLLGHSDADVLVHAVIDACLGALGKGDIGVLFPDTDERYKDISSVVLLGEVGRLIEDEGYAISNIDATVVAQAPKLRPYINEMEETMAAALRVTGDKVNVKGKTEEGLGFTGQGQGIKAMAVCSIYRGSV